jgi:hypothetical protein
MVKVRALLIHLYMLLISALYLTNQILLALALFQHVAAQCSGKSDGLAQHDCFAYQAL